MTHRPARFRLDEVALQKVTEMVSRKAVTGHQFELVQVYFKKGAIVPLHQQAAERLIYVLQGAVDVTGAGETVTVREGEVLVVPGGFLYEAECLDDTFVIVFGQKTAAVG
jgi:quercetin dioxygenase-like cupin family protein